MKEILVKQDDLEEVRLVKNVLTVLGGTNADVALNVLVKVLQPILIGCSNNAEHAKNFSTGIKSHLDEAFDKAAADDFGFLHRVDPEAEPIIYDELKDNI